MPIAEQNSLSKGITLIWNYSEVRAKEKVILQDVSGYCKPGQLLAIMGASGAGKTTLLSLLANKRSQQLQVQGQVKANNKVFSAQQFYNFGVYIYQNDILHQMLTVKQTLDFIAKLKIPDDQESERRVKKMISTFHLQKCQDTFVGGKFKKGISGGQKKRLCIAVEMISDPALLILDEPTSGLDSNKARSVVKELKNLAIEQQKTIIFTLHQPSYLIYKQLDRLMLLNKGRTIYQGKASQIYNYMTQQLNITVPLNLTLSDFFMMEISEFKVAKYDHKTLLNAQNYNLKLKENQDMLMQQAKNSIYSQGFDILEIQRSFWFMFVLLMSRQWLIFKRNPMKGVRVVFNSIVMVIIAGLIFLKGISDFRPTEEKLYDYKTLEIYFIKAQGVIFISIVSCIMTGIFSVALSFPNDKQIYYKETTSKKYLPIAYLISKIMIEAGSVIVGIIIFAIGQYFIVGFTIDFVELLKYILALVSCGLVGNSLGIFIGTLFKDGNKASGLTPLILLPLMMFSGMYNRLDSIPIWIRWVQYISPFRYGLHSVLLNEFNSEKFAVFNKGVLGVFDYKEDLDLSINYEGNIGFLLGLSLLYYGISFVLLKKLSSNLAP